MTPNQLYDLLDNAGVEFEIIEIFDGVRFLRVVVEEPETVSTTLEDVADGQD